MKKPPQEFTLVRRITEASERAPQKAIATRFRKAKQPDGLQAAATPTATRTVVGILDLGTYMGRLPQLLTALNEAQKPLRFYEVLAPIPAGLIKTEERLVQWMKESRDDPLTAGELADIQRNILFNEFSLAAEDIRTSAGVRADYLIGLTPAMVAGGYRNEVFWNYFSAAQGRILMVSTTDLREYAAKARRPFEVAVGGLMVATLLAQMTEGLDFHENRGCIFDKNEDRHTLVRNIRKPSIEPECLERMNPRLRAAALAIIERLKTME